MKAGVLAVLLSFFTLWASDPARERLFVGVTGETLHQGEIVISDIEFFYPFAEFGITNSFTLGVGGILIEPCFFVSSKFRIFSSKGFSMAVEGLYSKGGFGLSFSGAISYRTSNGIFSLSLYGLDLGNGGDFFGAVGGLYRVGKDIDVMGECFFNPRWDVEFVVFGVRVHPVRRLSIDLGILLAGNEYTPPWISFSYRIR